jgi:hypothetical protein
MVRQRARHEEGAWPDVREGSGIRSSGLAYHLFSSKKGVLPCVWVGIFFQVGRSKDFAAFFCPSQQLRLYNNVV